MMQNLIWLKATMLDFALPLAQVILQNFAQFMGKSTGYEVDGEIMSALSPYMMGHINRFGRYSLDLNRQPPNLDYKLLLDSLVLAETA